MGFTEVCVLLEEAGRACAPVPLWATLLLGAAPIERFGTAEQRRKLLPGVVSGKTILTAALLEETSPDPLHPSCRARRDADGWVLAGTKSFVPTARLADRILVSADTGDGLGVFLVDPGQPSVTLEAQATTTGDYEYRLQLRDTRVPQDAALGAETDGRSTVEWTLERATVGLCAMEVGLAERALRMAAEYTASRHQFGKPIATFQAVAQRAADAYIDLEALRLATLQAIWRVSAGLSAKRETAIAKFWAAEGGHRVCYAAQHLHGGIGVDTDYPLHHFYLQSRRIELTFGGTHTQLATLGQMLARTA
jgi:alkylation response protein AidB-like acyl-CoA dehydrogenase